MDIASRSFGIPSPKEGEVKGDTVGKAFVDGNIDTVNEYVMRDVEATINSKKIKTVYILREKGE